MANTLPTLEQILEGLTPEQRSRLRVMLEKEADSARLEKRALDILGGKSNGERCPHCGGGHIGRHGTHKGGPRWRCRDCGKTHTPFTGTVLCGIHDKAEFIRYVRSLVDGLSLRDAAKRHCICLETSFRWRHRLMEGLSATAQPDKLGGVVEADEKYIPYSCKGDPQAVAKEGRKARERGSDRSTRGISDEQVCVVSATDGDAPLLIATKRGRVDKASVKTAIAPRTRRKPAKPDTLITDGETAYRQLAKDKNMALEVVDSKTRKSPGGFHIQRVNSLHAKLDKWMRRFNGVASKYLQRYLDYFLSLEKVKDDFGGRFNKMLDLILQNRSLDMDNILHFYTKA